MRFAQSRFLLHRAVLVAGALAIATATHGAEGDQVTIVLTGDTGFNRSGQPVEADGVRRGGFQTWADTTSLIADDINGDLNFTNIETVVTDRNDLTPDTKGQGGPFNFRTHPNGLRHLAMRGFNVLSLANNHSMDYGLEGLKETLKHVGALKAERRAVAAGLGMNREEASRPVRVNVRGSEIAFAAIGIVTNNLERHRAGPDKPGQIAYRFKEDFAEVLKRLAATPAQYRILSIHYGVEGRVRTDETQIAEWRGEAAQKAGIDLIVGHHAHVVRGVELAGRSLIFYGLGNFLHHGTADMTGKGICRDYGLMARVHLKRGAGRTPRSARRRGDPGHRHALSPAPHRGREGRGPHPRAQLSGARRSMATARAACASRRSATAAGSTASPARTRTAAASARCARAMRPPRPSPTSCAPHRRLLRPLSSRAAAPLHRRGWERRGGPTLNCHPRTWSEDPGSSAPPSAGRRSFAPQLGASGASVAVGSLGPEVRG